MNNTELSNTESLKKPLQSRALEAVKSCLENKGYEIVGDTDRGLVAIEDGCIVFVSVLVRFKSKGQGFAEDRSTRETREMEACEWLAGNLDIEPMPFRFDEVSLIVVNDGRAILRHHVNCFENGEVA